MEFLLTVTRILALYAVPAAIVFVLLFFTVRGAVLSALRRHDTDLRAARASGTGSHLDADGM
ncbi:hypothetical protein QL996_13315 [Planococcus sp. APC 4015]|nr:hypothetical protein [Planococcus sp. APC 4015]